MTISQSIAIIIYGLFYLLQPLYMARRCRDEMRLKGLKSYPELPLVYVSLMVYNTFSFGLIYFFVSLWQKRYDPNVLMIELFWIFFTFFAGIPFVHYVLGIHDREIKGKWSVYYGLTTVFALLFITIVLLLINMFIK